jgi:NADP-dependent 3-hydroxy acid dehydrogenase YdfG
VEQQTADKAVEAAIKHFGTIDVLVNDVGVFRTKPFTDFTTEDFHALVSTKLLGFLYVAQLTVRQMLKQKSGKVVTASASLRSAVRRRKASVSMMTKAAPDPIYRIA